MAKKQFGGGTMTTGQPKPSTSRAPRGPSTPADVGAIIPPDEMPEILPPPTRCKYPFMSPDLAVGGGFTVGNKKYTALASAKRRAEATAVKNELDETVYRRFSVAPKDGGCIVKRLEDSTEAPATAS